MRVLAPLRLPNHLKRKHNIDLQVRFDLTPLPDPARGFYLPALCLMLWLQFDIYLAWERIYCDIRRRPICRGDVEREIKISVWNK